MYSYVALVPSSCGLAGATARSGRPIKEERGVGDPLSLHACAHDHAKSMLHREVAKRAL